MITLNRKGVDFTKKLKEAVSHGSQARK
jgi:hypothetical protein